MKKLLPLLLLCLLQGCFTNHKLVRMTQVYYRGYTVQTRVDGNRYLLEWRDSRGGAVFYSEQDSVPCYPIGMSMSSFLNF